MTVMTIRARFPLGVYQGHAADGSPDRFPDTARLHAALLQSASKGCQAIQRGNDLRASEASLRALTWLECHPPSALMLPVTRRVGSGELGISGYRDQGTWTTRKTDSTKKKSLKIHKDAFRMSTGQAVFGDFGWQWEDAPDDVIETIDRLCDDVICLGETDSPVVLTTGSIEPTHWLQTGSTQLRRIGIAMRTPAPGRVAALERDYELANPTKRPKESEDAYSTNEQAKGSSVTQDSLITQEYRDTTRLMPALPWPTAIVLASKQRISAAQRIDWAVAVHRMLVARAGDDCPASVTGSYIKSVQQPANRIAIQYITAGMHASAPDGAFLLLLPSGLALEDRQMIKRILRGSPRVYCRHGQTELTVLGEIPLGEFWPTPAKGWHRFWRPVPALIPETRRQSVRDGQFWTLRHASLLSLGFVFRDQIGTGLGRREYWELAERVAERNVRVLSTRVVADSQLGRYAHNVSAALGVVQPYQALIDLGDMVSNRALLCIGQSRHLGGGLLMPVDMPAEEESWN